MTSGETRNEADISDDVAARYDIQVITLVVVSFNLAMVVWLVRWQIRMETLVRRLVSLQAQLAAQSLEMDTLLQRKEKDRHV